MLFFSAGANFFGQKCYSAIFITFCISGGQWLVVKAGSMGPVGDCGEPYMGRTGGAHSILLSDGILWNIVYFVFYFL